MLLRHQQASDFNPRSPRGERPDEAASALAKFAFQSTLPARGATPRGLCTIRFFRISIHAPREGSDIVEKIKGIFKFISIHAPREGSDTRRPYRHGDRQIFQSTLPARGATVSQLPPSLTFSNFNPRSPRGERHCTRALAARANAFQSTLPARGATLQDFIKCNTQKNFNPRSPRGERRSMPLTMPKTSPFQSTLPARGATQQGLDVSVMDDISIHAPREGSDSTRT